MNKKSILIIFLIIIICIFAFGFYYINDYYHADDTARKYINGSENVTVTTIENGLFIDGPGNDTAMIFYPGAKVEYTSYLPILSQLSSKGVDCFLIEMPFNLAFFGKDYADNVISHHDYKHYYLSGHSLGGVMASEYAHNSDEIDGLILFEAYPTKKINKPVLSIFGSEDKVLNMEKYHESRPLMGKNLTEITIIGGNHAQVGNYGNQTGDGIANITPQKQQDISVEAIVRFIGQIN